MVIFVCHLKKIKLGEVGAVFPIEESVWKYVLASHAPLQSECFSSTMCATIFNITICIPTFLMRTSMVFKGGSMSCACSRVGNLAYEHSQDGCLVFGRIIVEDDQL